MRLIKLFFVSGLIFSFLAVLYVRMPKELRYEMEDWFVRLTAPGFDWKINEFSVREQDDVVSELRSKDFNPKCYGNLAPYEKMGKSNDYACWFIVKSAFDGVPAKMVMLAFERKSLVGVKMIFPESSFNGVKSYLDYSLKNYPRIPFQFSGKDDSGNPLLVWLVGDNVVMTSSKPETSKNVTVVWLSKDLMNLTGAKVKMLEKIKLLDSSVKEM